MPLAPPSRRRFQCRPTGRYCVILIRTGGKQKLGAVSKRGERTIRRLLIIGASAVVQQASRRGAPNGSWLAQMLARKPKMLVTVALANKMARVIWALLVKGGTYRAPAAAA